jgi:hypothetical protein
MFPLAFLVLVAQWTHFDSIPNSIVKRCGGEDTWGVAPWDNSSVPGSFFSPQLLIIKPLSGFHLVFVYVLTILKVRFLALPTTQKSTGNQTDVDV